MLKPIDFAVQCLCLLVLHMKLPKQASKKTKLGRGAYKQTHRAVVLTNSKNEGMQV